MSRCDELKWKYDDKYSEWRLYAPLHYWSEKDFLLARLKETRIKNKYVWTLADFKDETEAPSMSIYDAIGFENFETLDEAKSRVIYDLVNSVEVAITYLEDIEGLFL